MMLSEGSVRRLQVSDIAILGYAWLDIDIPGFRSDGWDYFVLGCISCHIRAL